MYGRIPDRAVVFMNSGWHKRYPNATLVFNSDDPTNPTTYHFPSWHEDTISWLISERSVVIVGVDTPSVDEGQSTIFPVHTLLGAADIRCYYSSWSSTAVKYFHHGDNYYTSRIRDHI
jgi:kynurenine formamidase